MFKKCLIFLFLFAFSFSSLGEARQSKASSARHSTARHKTKAGPVKKRRESLAVHKRKTRVVLSQRKRKAHAAVSSRKHQLHKAVSKKKQQVRTALSRKRHSRPTVTKTQNHQHKNVAVRKRPSPPLSIKNRRNDFLIPRPPTYLSQLNYHNQLNAKVGGFDQLYAKHLLGQGQTIAVVEHSGEWQELKNAMNKKEGGLSNETRERYKRNFLNPIGGPGLHPEEKTKWSRSDSYHGSMVASVVLDLTQANVLPVSTYNCLETHQSYDIANALSDLLQKKDVNIINLSSGHLEEKWDVRRDGKDKNFYKYVFPQKYITAFKAAAKAGKVIVFAAGNEALEVAKPAFHESIVSLHVQFMGYLVENLDSETLKSIVFAGAFEPDTRTISSSSNRPGNRVLQAQERFLFAPRKHQISYSGTISSGTSNSAPYICAAIANLASKPGVTPKKAVEALMETAEARPNEKHIYGRGLIRADRALEWLESRGF